VADIACPDQAGLADADLGEAAGFGLTRLIDIDRLQSGPLAPWSGKFVVVAPGVTVQATTLADTLLAAALDALRDSLFREEARPAGGEIRLGWVNVLRSLTVPRGEHGLSLAFTGLKRRGKVPVELRVAVGGKVLRRVPLTVSARAFAPVAVAIAPVRKGELFQAESVGEEIRDVTSFIPGTLPKREECLGFAATASVLPGRIITRRWVDRPALVRRGDRVPLVIRRGAVHVAIDAIARRDGHAGEMVPVWNPASKKMVHAQVLSDGTLRLFGDGG
jgi:flagella basal body P-ring formation protein FlgA